MYSNTWTAKFFMDHSVAECTLHIICTIVKQLRSSFVYYTITYLFTYTYARTSYGSAKIALIAAH